MRRSEDVPVCQTSSAYFFFSQPGVNLWLSCRVQAARLVRWHIGLSKVMLSIRGASGQGTGKYSTSVESKFTLWTSTGQRQDIFTRRGPYPSELLILVLQILLDQSFQRWRGIPLPRLLIPHVALSNCFCHKVSVYFGCGFVSFVQPVSVSARLQGHSIAYVSCIICFVAVWAFKNTRPTCLDTNHHYDCNK